MEGSLGRRARGECFREELVVSFSNWVGFDGFVRGKGAGQALRSPSSLGNVLLHIVSTSTTDLADWHGGETPASAWSTEAIEPLHPG